jgi:NTP pyrophosphatase (non-canonical NTP hydrolase)
MKTVDDVIGMLRYKLNEKGYGTFSSRHEILGVVTEEYHEFVEAVHKKDHVEMKNELIDIAVGCIFSAACIEEKTIDW